jgi:hypothetical protein
MNRVTRLLALAGAGIGVAASVAVGTAPAQAAGQSGTHSASVQAKANWDRDDYRIIHVFDSPRGCVRVGRIGEIRGEWDEWACFRVRDNHDGLRLRSSRYDNRYDGLRMRDGRDGRRDGLRFRDGGRDSDYALVVSDDDDCDWDDYRNDGLFYDRPYFRF